MEKATKDKLTRLLRNSNLFLWGVFDCDMSKGRKQKIYDEINQKLKGVYLHISMTYDVATESLLSNKDIGIEKIISELVKPKIYERYSKDLMNDLRSKWLMGERPQIQFIKYYSIKKEFPFLEITATKDFENVGGWKPFAMIWFEEIEPYVKNSDRAV